MPRRSRDIAPGALQPDSGNGGLVLLFAGLVAAVAVVGAPMAWRSWRTRRLWRAYGPY